MAHLYFGIWSKLYSIRKETRWISQITRVIYVTSVVPVVINLNVIEFGPVRLGYICYIFKGKVLVKYLLFVINFGDPLSSLNLKFIHR